MIEELFIAEDATVREAMRAIDANATYGIALVRTTEGRLAGVLTDGDLRRAMLVGLALDAPVSEALALQPVEEFERPLTTHAGASQSDLLELMTRYRVRQIPLVDEAGQVVEVALLQSLVEETRPALRAVIMAGGFGRRLGPLTEELPKPMLPVGDRPLLERIIEQLRDAGIHRVQLTTHYRAEAISAHFGDGDGFGVEIGYVNETEPLGTAGALGLLERTDEPVLVVNGDIVTGVDFGALLRFHEEHVADMTVAVWPYELRVPYGVIETSDGIVSGISEKPVVRSFVNAGIYLIAPRVLELVPAGVHFDMPELIERALADGLRVASFPLREYWLDIGQPDDYARAVSAAADEQGRS